MNPAREKRFLLVGPVGAGKTTLLHALFGLGGPVRKTQAVDFGDEHALDTPGEYFSYPRLFHALIHSSIEVETIVYVHAADDFACRMPPGLLDVYRGKRMFGVITKIDLPAADPDRVEQLLRDNGVHGPIFRVSGLRPETLPQLRAALDEPAGCEVAVEAQRT